MSKFKLNDKVRIIGYLYFTDKVGIVLDIRESAPVIDMYQKPKETYIYSVVFNDNHSYEFFEKDLRLDPYHLREEKLNDLGI